MERLIDFCLRADWALPSVPVMMASKAETNVRQSCDWTPKECYDLVNALTAGAHVEDLARRHRRTLRGLQLFLDRGLAIRGVDDYLRRSA